MSYVSALPGVSRIQAMRDRVREEFAVIRRIPDGLTQFESEMSAWREVWDRGEMNAVAMLRLQNEIEMAKNAVTDLAGRLRAAEDLPEDLAMVDGVTTGTGVNVSRAEHIRNVREQHDAAVKYLGKLESRLADSLAGLPDAPASDPQAHYPATHDERVTSIPALRGLRSV